MLTSLVGVTRKVTAENTFGKGRTPEELLEMFLMVLMRLYEKGRFAAANKSNVFTKSVTGAEKYTPTIE